MNSNTLNLQFCIRLIIGLTLFAYASFRVEWPMVMQAIRSADVVLLVLAVVSSFILGLLKCYRWMLLLQCLGIKLPYWRLLDYATIANTHAAVTPGRLGEISKVHLLGRHKVGKLKALQSLLGDRALDFVPMVFLALVTVGLLGVLPWGSVSMLVFGVVLMLVVSVVWARWIGWTMEGQYQLNWLAVVSGLTMLFYMVLNYWLITAVHIQVNFLICGGIAAAMGISSMLPVSIAGIGVRDVLLTSLATHLQAAPEQMLALSMLELLFLLILPFAHRQLYLLFAFQFRRAGKLGCDL